MKRLSSLTLLAAIAVSAGALGQSAPASDFAEAKRFPNCKALNARYPHGVGRVGARDKTSGTPVTNFKRSNRLYRQNRHLDRDKDGIACEKR